MWDMQIYIIADSAWPWAAGSILQPNLVCILRGAGAALPLRPWRMKPRWHLAGARAPAASGGCHLLRWMWVTRTQKSPLSPCTIPWETPPRGTEREDLELQRSPRWAAAALTHAHVCARVPGQRTLLRGSLHRHGVHGPAHRHTIPRARGVQEQTGRMRAHASRHVRAQRCPRVYLSQRPWIINARGRSSSVHTWARTAQHPLNKLTPLPCLLPPG